MTNEKKNELRMPTPGAPVANTDDPRLTAYALGELDSEDVAAVERYLEASSEGRDLVEEMRAFAGVLSEELSTEAAPSLAPEQRATLTAALEAGTGPGSGTGAVPVNGRRSGSRGAVLRLWLTTAAAVVLGVLTWRLATSGTPVVSGDLVVAPQNSVARLDERASGAKYEHRVGFGKGALDTRNEDVSAELDANARRLGKRSQADEDGLERLQALGYVGKQRDAVPSSERAKQLRELGYLESPRAASAPPAEAGEELVLEMYDVRDLVGRQRANGSADYNLLPSGTEEGIASELFMADDGEAEGFTYDLYSVVKPELEPPQDGDVVLEDMLVPSPDLSREVIGVGSDPSARAAVSGAAGALTGRGRKVPAAPADRPVAFAEPSPTPAAAPTDEADLRVLRALGYTDGSTVDADDDSLGIDLRYARRFAPTAGGESYAPIHENEFQPLTKDRYTALSTFGIDVDTASYSNARRFLNRNQAPPPNAVRLEEFINAFDYDLPAPQGEHPFSVSVDAANAPWAPRHRLVRIGLKGVEFDEGERPASNLVFLLDVSGSMKSQDKLPLLVKSLKLLVGELDENDRVAIVTYASGTRLALPSTSGADKGTIVAALDSLTAGGSTNASDGIQRAYQLATEHFIEGGTNRVLLATDGDFNVGITENGPLETFIADKARSGVFLTVLGFGTGNFKDSKAEVLADRGNGNYAYIDNLNEAERALVREMSGTLVTIAKDVKLQVEFNPGRVAAYRLLGYENRALAPQDFRDDKKDAGEIGAGHTVTALYEIVPVGVGSLPGAVELKYQAAPPEPEVVVDSPELLTVNLRYKLPDEDSAHEFAVGFVDGETTFDSASSDFRFAAAVASFGMVLRHSAHRGDVNLGAVYDWAAAAKGDDPHGDRAEFLRLVRTAQGMSGF